MTSITIIATTPNLLHHREGAHFEIYIHIALPLHEDVVVTKTCEDVHQREHISAAIKEAFAAAVRQIEDAVRQMRK